MEVLADAAKYTKRIETLTEYVRSGLSRQICNTIQSPDKKVRVITINPSLETNIRGYVQETDFGNFLNLPPDVNSQFIASLNEEVKRSNSYGYQPALLVTPELRKPVRRLIEREMRFLPVISYNEILPEIELEAVGMVSV
jgi:flagellar biosynthesis protein FlhA